jgi:hypothetical protein
MKLLPREAGRNRVQLIKEKISERRNKVCP